MGTGLFADVPIFITAIAVILAAGIALVIFKALLVWSRNNSAPLLTVPTTVLSRRAHRSAGTADTGPTSSYYVTFEMIGGERMEFQLTGAQYGLIVESDRGELTYQGTRFCGFARTPQGS